MLITSIWKEVALLICNVTQLFLNNTSFLLILRKRKLHFFSTVILRQLLTPKIQDHETQMYEYPFLQDRLKYPAQSKPKRFKNFWHMECPAKGLRLTRELYR